MRKGENGQMAYGRGGCAGGAMPRAGLLMVLLALILMPLGAASVRADEGTDGRGKRSASDGLHLQIFDVGSLTCGWYSFLGERAPPVSWADISDEEHPLFGSTAEEPWYALGEVDELMDLVRGFVRPAFWESAEGAYLSALGARAIVAKGTPEVLAEVAGFLVRLERRALSSALIEVRVSRKGADAAAASLSLCGFLGQRVSGFSGTRHAYLQDFDVEVAESASISNPFVGVANLGLRVDARVLAGGDAKRTSIELDAFFAQLADPRTVPAGEGRTLDVPSFRVFRTRATVEVTPRTWTRVSGGGSSGGWTLEVRVTPRTPELSAARPNPIQVTTTGPQERGVELIDVSDLNHSVAPSLGPVPRLMPSRFTPPEPPELPEPTPAVSANHLPQLILEASPPDVWNDPASIEARNGTLIVRHTRAVRASIRTLLASLRRDFLWTVETRVDVVDMPIDMLTALRKGAHGGFVLGADAGAFLQVQMREGTVKHLGRVDLPGRAGVPTAVSDGEYVAYLQDQEVEIAKSAAISNPVMQSFFSGLALEVTAYRTGGGDAVAMDVRVARTSHDRQIRRVPTPSGEVEFPRLHTFRIRAGVVVPFGRTAVLATRGEGGTYRRVILLTPTLRRK